jgi:2-keto-3-deoxy-6-phosphogluconate aldolase
MSQLQKIIARIQRREGPAIGFGRVSREKPRAMALVATVRSSADARAALDAGADAVLFVAGSASLAVEQLREVAGPKVAAGVSLPVLSVADAELLRNAGCDFVVSPLETTDSAAVDVEKMGHLVAASESIEDNTLRALGPLGLDGLFVKRTHGPMKLSEQLGLVRLSSFSATGLVVTVDLAASPADLRVLRDSGVVAIVAPEGATAADIASLDERLRAVPAPRKPRSDSTQVALVPSLVGGHDHDEEDDDGEEE